MALPLPLALALALALALVLALTLALALSLAMGGVRRGGAGCGGAVWGPWGRTAALRLAARRFQRACCARPRGAVGSYLA